MMSFQLRDDNIVAINDGGNTLTDPSTTSWVKYAQYDMVGEMHDPSED